MESKLFNQIWDQLRIKKSQYAQYLDQGVYDKLQEIRKFGYHQNKKVWTGKKKFSPS